MKFEDHCFDGQKCGATTTGCLVGQCLRNRPSEHITIMTAVPRDGKWMDSMGACKLCDGEIPHGHSSDCDYYKLDRQLSAAKRALEKLSKAAWDSVDVRCFAMQALTKNIPEGFRECEFCGCITNAKIRACCNTGREKDRNANVNL